MKFKYEMLDFIGTLKRKPHFFRFSWEYQNFTTFKVIHVLSFSKPFWNSFNFASTSNVQEVIRFDRLSENSFETNFE